MVRRYRERFDRDSSPNDRNVRHLARKASGCAHRFSGCPKRPASCRASLFATLVDASQDARSASCSTTRSTAKAADAVVPEPFRRERDEVRSRRSCKWTSGWCRRRRDRRPARRAAGVSVALRISAAARRDEPRARTASRSSRRIAADSTPTPYIRAVGRAIVGEHDPAEVVLLEIDPQHQKTLAGFRGDRADVGRARRRSARGRTRRARSLFCSRDGTLTPIKRIYNRVIPDELERKGVTLAVRLPRRSRRRVDRRAGLVLPDQQVLDSVAAASVGAEDALSRATSTTLPEPIATRGC